MEAERAATGSLTHHEQCPADLHGVWQELKELQSVVECIHVSLTDQVAVREMVPPSTTPPSTTTTTTSPAHASASSPSTGIEAAGKRQETQQGRVVDVILTDGMLGILTDSNLRITELVEGSSVCKHNCERPLDAIHVGDIVEAINGYAVKNRSDIRAAIASSPAGQPASFLLGANSYKDVPETWERYIQAGELRGSERS